MIPRSIDIVFNLRFSSELTQNNIKDKFKEITSQNLIANMKLIGVVQLNLSLQMKAA